MAKKQAASSGIGLGGLVFVVFMALKLTWRIVVASVRALVQVAEWAGRRRKGSGK